MGSEGGCGCVCVRQRGEERLDKTTYLTIGMDIDRTEDSHQHASPASGGPREAAAPLALISTFPTL